MPRPTTNTVDVSLAARQYASKGWVLVPIDHGTKGPSSRGWNTIGQCITQPEQCGRIKNNMGLAHAFSRTAALDLDDITGAAAWLAQQGVALQNLLNAPDAVRISSGRPNRGKLLYRLPDGVAPLPSKAIKGEANRTVLELRCATAEGLTVQDVLPPSIHPDTGEAYVWEYGDPLIGSWQDLPALPSELLALWQGLLAPATKEVSDKAPLGLGKRELRELLGHFSPDAGYHEWIDTGFALHHETRGGELGLDLWDEWSTAGATYKGREDLAQHWDSFGKRATGPIKTVRSLMASVGVTADDFEDLTIVSSGPDGEIVKAPKFLVQSATAFAARAPMRWLIKGILPQAGLAVIYGESGAGKTFAVTDLVLAIARGLEWRGHRVRQGRVVYICAEGQGGFQNRLQAYAQRQEVDMAEVPLGVISDVPNFLAHDDKQVAAQIQAWGGAQVVVVDTFAQVTPGGNENSGEDMGKALAHCRRLHAATGALVILVHHSGKDAAKGARGWSGLKAAADTEIEVMRDGDHRAMRVSKQKDGEEGQELGFRLTPVTLGVDEDGDEITSCVVEHGEVVARAQRKSEPKGNVQRMVMRAVQDLAGIGGADVLATDLIDTVVNQMVAPEHGKRDQRRSHVMRAIEALSAGNALRIDAGKVLAC